ncbi:synaptotagmin-1-like isoform X2 [Amphiura filiformis]|uniref:synaptotagmin-1-like isoform X2 n=1 Tax=Amphiura filiformis TaxID=82378 RepID=UPI003B211ED8
MYSKLVNMTMLNQPFLPHLQRDIISRVISDHQPTQTVRRYPEPDELNPGVVAAVVISFIIFLIITLAVVCYAYRHAKKVMDQKKRKARSASELNIPQALLEPVEFTIPTAPQMPHEMPRGYIHHIRSSAPYTKKKDVSNGRAPKLGIIGRSKSDNTSYSNSASGRWALLARSYSDPCKPSRLKKKIESNIGTIDPALYAIDNDDLQEFKPSKYGLGKMSFSLSYQKDTNLLTVNLIQAAQLPRLLQKNIDTFVKITLMPDRENKRAATSKICRRSLNPRYNQTFVFQLADSILPETVLRFVVFHYDRYSHPQVIGKAVYELQNHDFDVLGSRDAIWRDLIEHPWEDELPPVDTNRGEILFSLNYLPNAERINITVLKARNIRTSIIADPPCTQSLLSAAERPPPACPLPADKTAQGIYAKVSIVKGGKQVKCKQTAVVRKDLNPVFNQSFAMELKMNSTTPAW